MSMGFCPVFDSQPQYRRCIFNWGKDIVRCQEYFTAVLQELGVRLLMDFFCMSRLDAIEETGEEGVEEAEMHGSLHDGRWSCNGAYLWSVGTEWFVPAEGLKTVNALLKQIEAEPLSLDKGIASEEDRQSALLALQDIQEILSDAERKQRRFHLARV